MPVERLIVSDAWLLVKLNASKNARRRTREPNVKKRSTKPPAPAGPAATTETWELRLYVAGPTPRSVAAFTNLKKLCEEHLRGRYKIEVIDLLQQPQLAAGDQILAIPTLVRKLPEPLRRVIGDLRNTERTLVGLNLRPAEDRR